MTTTLRHSFSLLSWHGIEWHGMMLKTCCERRNNMKHRRGFLPRLMMQALEKNYITIRSSSQSIPEAVQITQTQREKKEMDIRVEDICPGILQLIPNTDGKEPVDFCTFMESSSKQQVISFFRQVIHQVEVRRKILDFHLKLKNDVTKGFVIKIFYGDEYGGPEDLSNGRPCISCCADAPLYPFGDVLAGECVLKEFSDQSYVQCCLDAKARPGFIVTPLRHVDRMSELDDEEMYYLWWVGVRALRNEGFSMFKSMILNHGCYRNVAHLHLKIWVDPQLHAAAREKWSEVKKMLWRRLEDLAKLLYERRVGL